MNGLNLQKEVDKEIIEIILHVVIPYEVALSVNNMNLATTLLEKKFEYYHEICINIAKTIGSEELYAQIESIIAINIDLVSDFYEAQKEAIKNRNVVSKEELHNLTNAGISAFA